jgi:hypothetical protein
VKGARDGRTDAQEIIQESFLRLEELSFGRSVFRGELCDASHKSSFFCRFKDRSSFVLPWLLDDGNSKTQDDAELRERISGIVRKAIDDNPASRSDVAKALLLSIEQKREEGGLGLRYEADRSLAKRDGVSAFVAGVGDCHAMAYLFYAMARLSDLDPTFIRVSGKKMEQSGKVTEIFHVAVAVRLDRAHPEILTPMDPSQGIILDDSYQWYPITTMEMTAYHLRNVAFNNVPKDLSVVRAIAWQEALLQKSLALTPDDFEVEYDVAKFFDDKKNDPHGALNHLRRAREINPSLRATWEE